MDYVDLSVQGRGRLLDNAAQMAQERHYFDFPIIDTDCHHLDVPMGELLPYLDRPWRDRLAHISAGKAEVIPTDPRVGDRDLWGRVKRPHPPVPDGDPVPPSVYPTRFSAQQLGIDCSIVFPTDMLNLGMHPDPETEVALAFAYARWITERVLPHEASILSMLYLPFSDPRASLKIIEAFGSRPGVCGFMVTSVRHHRVHEDGYMPVYAAIEERGLPLGFHSAPNWRERPFQVFNSFLSAHAFGFPFYNALHLINLVINGIPERFPRLRFYFIECGVAWLPMLLARLDTAFMMRPSEAPLLKRKPSEYMREFYYSTQPLEFPSEPEQLAVIFDAISADTRLMYASDYPHWDFDTPGRIYDLPFLSEDAKKGILGGNAIKLFHLEDRVDGWLAAKRGRNGATAFHRTPSPPAQIGTDRRRPN